jgi:hypothetical protein
MPDLNGRWASNSQEWSGLGRVRSVASIFWGDDQSVMGVQLCLTMIALAFRPSSEAAR